MVTQNRRLARLFEELARLLEFTGANPFRVRSYKRASEYIGMLDEDVTLLQATGELAGVDGFGEGMLGHVSEFLKTGSIALLETLRKEIPPGIPELLDIPSIGTATVRAAYDAYGITNRDDLAQACRDGRMRVLPRFGMKKERNILAAIERYAGSSTDHIRGEIAMDVAQLTRAIRFIPGIRRAEIAGAFRRGCETVAGIDVVASPRDPIDTDAILQGFCMLPDVADIVDEGTHRASVRLRNGVPATIHIVPDDAYGTCLQYHTGSPAHNEHLGRIADERGIRRHERGIICGDRPVACATEEDFYRAHGLAWIPPELREDRGEIEAALGGTLPNLVTPSDIRGDVHVHSTWSDGEDTIEAMAITAQGLGYEYLVITDHSRTLKIAGGLTPERVMGQCDEIDRLNRQLAPFRIFTGTEMDIRPDGSLDFPDDLLGRLDFVIASIHSAFDEPEEQITMRLLSAIRNPYVTMIGHPTGRLINRRPPYRLDLGRIIAEAARTGTFLEINSFHDRLDLDDRHARAARDAGVRLCIGTDAHRCRHLAHVAFGVTQARRAWLSSQDIVNCLPLAGFADAIQSKRRVMNGNPA